MKLKLKIVFNYMIWARSIEAEFRPSVGIYITLALFYWTAV